MAHTYYRPPLGIRDVGRPLKADNFAALKDSLSDGEVLFELMEHANHEHYAVLTIDAPSAEDFRQPST